MGAPNQACVFSPRLCSTPAKRLVGLQCHITPALSAVEQSRSACRPQSQPERCKTRTLHAARRGRTTTYAPVLLADELLQLELARLRVQHLVQPEIGVDHGGAQVAALIGG